MIWVEERQLGDELSSARRGMAWHSNVLGMAWHAPERQLLNFTTALWPVACANCTTVQLHKIDLCTFKGGGQNKRVVITNSIIVINSNALKITMKKGLTKRKNDGDSDSDRIEFSWRQ